MIRSLTLSSISLLIFTGCQLTYYTKSAYNHLSILSQRQNLTKALERGDLTEIEKQKLRLTLEVREFIEREFGLNIKDNYTHYVHLDKKFPVWAVNASPKWKLEHYHWDFLFVGKVPYKGFPSLEEAEKEAELLQKKDFDTYVRGVSAYSTLGWFSDPILSSMLRYSDQDLVNTIIHETTHATLFIKSHADFNERLATFVGNKGAELFFLNKEGKDSHSLKLIQEDIHDELLFSTFISEELKTLEKNYLQAQERSDEQRQIWFDNIKERFKREIQPHLKTKNYDQFTKSPINNARLLLFRTYSEDLSDFEQLWQLSGQNMRNFLHQAKSLEKSKDPIASLKELIVHLSKR